MGPQSDTGWSLGTKGPEQPEWGERSEAPGRGSDRGERTGWCLRSWKPVMGEEIDWTTLPLALTSRSLATAISAHIKVGTRSPCSAP